MFFKLKTLIFMVRSLLAVMVFESLSVGLIVVCSCISGYHARRLRSRMWSSRCLCLVPIIRLFSRYMHCWFVVDHLIVQYEQKASARW